MKKQKFNYHSLVGMEEGKATELIHNDNDNGFYWLSVCAGYRENSAHYIRFPYGAEFTIIWDDNGIITKVY